MIEDGKTVSLEYTLTLEDGSVADTNVGGDPLKYEHGKGQILPALEKELAGMEVNDTKQVTLPPEKGYGEHDPDAMQTVKPEQIPEDARKVGSLLVARDNQGNEMQVKVTEVRDEDIVLDLNHPLAGETLKFDVKVVGIE